MQVTDREVRPNSYGRLHMDIKTQKLSNLFKNTL